MQWERRLSASAAAQGGWKGDFPLSHDLPAEITLDCARLRLPIYPLFAIRLSTFIAWHAARGCNIVVIRPDDVEARHVFDALQLATEPDVEHVPPITSDGDESDIVLPVTRLHEFRDVDAVAERTREILEYQLTDVSALGHASYMAVAELCGNAVEHGQNQMGALVAAVRSTDPRRQVSIAIGDLGIGIPEHLRQRFPEWFDDSHAIAQALAPGVTGTGDPHRGNGFNETFEAALVSSLHSARVDIHSATGFVRTQFYGGTRKQEPFPAANPRRGTWISYDLVAI